MATRLPSLFTSFVGRTEELANLEALLSGEAQIVTLVGPPGVGKTLLARRFAATTPGEHAFVDLSLARTSEELVELAASALDVPLDPTSRGSDLVAQVGRALSGRGVLLVVLDNFDQLVDDSEILCQWAEAASEVSFLVTSRERLRVAGEHVVRVGPLAVPEPGEDDPNRIAGTDAVKLLASRTARLGAFDGGALRTLAAIARALEGLPLALALCAARLEVLGADKTLELLEQRLDLLVARSRGGPARQATLRAAIDGSWELLGPREREAMAACSVFRAGFDLDAAIAVLAPEPDATSAALWTLEVLEALSDKSLINIEDDDGGGSMKRYALSETLRAYAAEKLATPDAALRHAAYFATRGRHWASRANGPSAPAALGWIRRERDNLLAARDAELARGADPAALARAVEAVLALEPVFVARGPIARYLALLEDTLARPGAANLDASLYARALFSRGLMRSFAGVWRESAVDFAGAIAAAERAGDAATATLAEIRLAQLRVAEGDGDAAEEGFARAESRLEPTDPFLHAILLRQRGGLYARTGRIEPAMAEFRRAIPLLRDAGSRREEALTLGSLGWCQMNRGALRAAQEHFESAIALLRELGDRRIEGLYLGHLGCIDQELGRFSEAASRFREALQIQREVGDVAFEGLALGYLGGLALELGDGIEAAERYGEAARLLAGDTRVSGMMIAMRGAALSLDDALLEADACFDDAAALFARAGTGTDHAALDLLRAFGDAARAERRAREGSAREAEQLLAAARSLAESYAGRGLLEDDVRFAHRLLVARLRAPAEPPASRPRGAALRIAADGRWFARAPERHVDLTRRRALSRILARLSAAHRADPTAALTLDTLFEAGWPGEKAIGDTAATRVYNAVQRLRKLGLERLLVTRDDGYLLDPSAAIEVEVEPFRSR